MFVQESNFATDARLITGHRIQLINLSGCQSIHTGTGGLRDSYDRHLPPWMDLTTGLADGSMSLRRIPESWSSRGADFGGGWDYDADVRHQHENSQHEQLNKKYRYTPLPDKSNDIRLVCLLPGQGDEPLRAQIKTFCLDDPPSYEALSYAWGSKVDNAVVIICEGGADHSVEVPRSLHGALKRLRHKLKTRAIWTDAICINQTDDQEKGHQVRLMRRIYKRATRVVIWLGDQLTRGRKAGPIFDLISQMYRRNYEAVPPPEDTETWETFMEIFMSPWFRRVWCLQEAILAPSAEVMFGEHSIPWEHIGFAATWVRCLPLQMFWYALVGVYNACLVHSLSQANEEHQRVSFLQLLTLTRPFEATNLRDKVYGILGIPTTDSDPDLERPFLQPDYTKTLSEVYIDCALTIIRKTQSLRILSYVQHRRTHNSSWRIAGDQTLIEVPSWYPRWHEFFARTLTPSEYEDKTFNASASLQLDSVANIHIRGLEVITCGAQISRVQNVSPLLKTWGRTTIHSVSRLCIDVVNSLKSLESSTADLTELLYTMSALVTAGKDWSGRIIEDSEQHFADLVALMYDPVVLSDQVETYLYKIERPNRLQDLLFRPRTDIALPPVTKTGQAHRFLEAMRNACTLRCLLITEDGHVGLGPQVSKLGDVLCILKDATVPLLLRPIAGSDSFKLVGETYMQGMMFGEVTISQVEQIVLSDKPFADPVELEVVTNNPSQIRQFSKEAVLMRIPSRQYALLDA